VLSFELEAPHYRSNLIPPRDAPPYMNTDELQKDAVASRYLIKRPKALQYYYNGVLRKESEGERAAGRFELFLDLLCWSIIGLHLSERHAN
jgi:hypothetical protein